MLNILNAIFNTVNLILRRQPDEIRTKAGAKVEIYTWATCPFCLRAKWLLWRKGVNYIEYKIDGDAAGRQAMAERAQGRRTVPQIFINDQHIGGFDDLNSLHHQGRLNALLD